MDCDLCHKQKGYLLILFYCGFNSLNYFCFNFFIYTFVRNPSVSLSPTLTIIEKVEHHIRIKAHKPIALRFWVESGVGILCSWAQI